MKPIVPFQTRLNSGTMRYGLLTTLCNLKQEFPNPLPFVRPEAPGDTLVHPIRVTQEMSP